MTLTAKRARELLSYNPVTGVITWKVAPSWRTRAGDVAGHVAKKSGYRYISIGHKKYGAHRVAWLLTHGKWPRADLDHENCRRDDNWLTNLREATRTYNRANTKCRRDSRSGLKGVHLHGKKWQASATKDGVTHCLGTFLTRREAAAAYDVAAKQLFGEFARTNEMT